MRFFTVLAAASLFALPAIADSHGPKPLAAPSVKTEAPAPTPGHELGLYRFGSTYRTVESASPEACQALCGSDKACYAWSHVRAAYSVHARCELKRSGGRVEKNPAATSGYSPMKEQQHQPVRVMMKAPRDLAGARVKAASGTIVTSQAVPLGSTPTITYKPRYETTSPKLKTGE